MAIAALVSSFELSPRFCIGVKKTLLNTAAVAFAATAVAANAVGISKFDFIMKASQGVSIERNLKQLE